MVATFPTQHPFPVSSGGLAHDPAIRPLSQAQQVRQPYLGNAPQVSNTGLSAFGVATGAGIQNNGSDADQSQGIVKIRCGLGPGPSGTIVLSFPVAPLASQYAAFADWATIANPIAVVGSSLAINWTANRPLLPNEVLTLAYQWAVSQ